MHSKHVAANSVLRIPVPLMFEDAALQFTSQKAKSEVSKFELS